MLLLIFFFNFSISAAIISITAHLSLVGQDVLSSSVMSDEPISILRTDYERVS